MAPPHPWLIAPGCWLPANIGRPWWGWLGAWLCGCIRWLLPPAARLLPFLHSHGYPERHCCACGKGQPGAVWGLYEQVEADRALGFSRFTFYVGSGYPFPAGPRTHSQEGQDALVAEVLGGKVGGYYVDLAANDPVVFSDTMMLERDYHWR